MISIKNVVIGIAIIILTIFVAVYGIGMIYESPDYSDFCGDKETGPVETDDECISVGGKWTSFESEGGAPRQVVKEGAGGWCDINFQCREDYEEARENYAKILFLITLPLGIALIIIGILVFGLEVVGAGLAGGGIGIMLWGIGEYWRYGSDLLKFALSLIGLVVVIFLAYWFNRKKK
jgi:hypothetical protein